MDGVNWRFVLLCIVVYAPLLIWRAVTYPFRAILSRINRQP